MNTPLPVVSVIVPVYNTAPYLRECLDSVLGQTMPELEVICVNDGSTDDGPAILAEYAASDGRIRLISQENRGLSAARNRGLEIARGKFVYFLDSDDYLEPAALENLVQTAEAQELEVLRFESERFYESEKMFELFHLERKHVEEATAVCTGVEYLGMMKDAGMYLPGVWRALWRRSLLTENRLRFKNGVLFEDYLFSFQALFCAKRVMHIPDRFHHYRIRVNSITTSPNYAKRAFSFFSSAEELLFPAFGKDYPPTEERELRRAFSGMIQSAARSYAHLSKQEQADVVFPHAMEDELFKQLVTPRIRARRLKKKLDGQTEALEALRLETERQRREIEQLRQELQQLKGDDALPGTEETRQPEEKEQ